MQIGLVLPLSDAEGPGAGAWPQIRRLATLAEGLGIDGLWVYDHLVFRGLDEEDGGPLEAWTVLAALAAVTERAALGTIVLGTGFRPPALTAKMAATLDEVSGGRLILGLGTGWHEPEYRAFGYPFDRRVGRFEEALRIIVPLLRGEHVTLAGEFHAVEDAFLIPPPPRPGRLPILVASAKPRTLRLTARWADAWNAAWFGVPDERFASRRAAMVEACEAEGRDPATLEVTVGVSVGETGATSLALDVDVLAGAFDAWRDEGVGAVQLALGRMDEAAVELVAAARARHLGGLTP